MYGCNRVAVGLNKRALQQRPRVYTRAFLHAFTIVYKDLLYIWSSPSHNPMMHIAYFSPFQQNL